MKRTCHFRGRGRSYPARLKPERLRHHHDVLLRCRLKGVSRSGNVILQFYRTGFTLARGFFPMTFAGFRTCRANRSLPDQVYRINVRLGPRFRIRSLIGFGLFMVAYYFAYRFGMTFSQTLASPFWFPDSVLLCALLLSPPRLWWIFIVATLPIRLLVAVPAQTPLWFLLTTFTIDSTKGVFTAALLRRFLKNPLRLQTYQDFGVYCLFAVLLIPAANAFAGAGARHLLGFAYWPAWEQWFMGNAMTQLIVTPALLYLVVEPFRNWRRPTGKEWIEGGLLLAGLIVTAYIAFHTESVQIGSNEARFYAPVPFLFWAAIRFRMLGATGSITLITLFAVTAAIQRRGFFAGLSPDETALAFQHFLLLRAAPLYLVAILMKQTDRAEANVQKQRLELAHAARVSTLGQLASALAHELNQPLGAILRNAEAGEMILQQGSPDYQEIGAILADIRHDDQRAASVIERMRSLLSRRNLQFQKLSLRELIEQVLLLTRAEMRAREVTLEVNLLDNLSPIRGDRIHLQQVILNLLVNGADAMTGVPAEQRQLQVQVHNGRNLMMEVTVRDRGSGLPSDMPTQVFEPFFTTKSDGMGMGLAISKTIIEAHGGRIWAENNIDGGAAFRFTLRTAETEGLM